MRAIRSKDIMRKYRCNSVLGCPCNKNENTHRITCIHQNEIVFECSNANHRNHRMRFDEMNRRYRKKLLKCLNKVLDFKSERFKIAFANLNLKYVPPPPQQQEQDFSLDFVRGVIEYTGEAWNNHKATEDSNKLEFRVDNKPVPMGGGANVLNAIIEYAREL